MAVELDPDMLDSPALCDFCKSPVLPGSDGVCASCAAIVEAVQTKRRTGALPAPPLSNSEMRAQGPLVVVKSGAPEPCSVCDEPIGAEQERHEYRTPDRRTVTVHPICHAVWQKLRPI